MSGTTDKIKGRVKEAVGVLTDNQRLKDEGRPKKLYVGNLAFTDQNEHLKTMKGKIVPLRAPEEVTKDPCYQTSEPLKSFVVGSPNPFPLVRTRPELPLAMPDALLDYYGWVFCQKGFTNLGMTFEQFLTVVTTFSASRLSA